jgi:hypothetical protein
MWRTIGEKKFISAPLRKLSPTYWQAIIPSESIDGDFEYYITTGGSKPHVFPVSAPSLNQAVVLLKK